MRQRAAEKLARGALQAALSIAREGVPPVVRVNDTVLDAVLATLQGLTRRDRRRAAAARRHPGVKGVIEVVDAQEHEGERQAAEAAVLAGFENALTDLAQMRRHEGEAFGRVLSDALVRDRRRSRQRADATPGRQPEAIKQRLTEQVAALLETGARLDPTACTRKRSCSPPKPMSARSSIA